ncbi:hypothetical protein GCM10009116_02290 [Brevundimonas basaltis]|uniref:Ammonium transporter n=1 Tax=Brevundimonas basaltis TaxID=472166 RepID=A0A7W8MH14_9CAUL|nr:hypothetical protein [Brevundimonas basaltis]MBB5292500.1 hypothetical protein [Brevundimonas basaltis]
MTKRLGWAIALAALMLGSAFALRYAEGQGMIGADTAKRGVQVLIGLVLAGYANLMPKRLGPARASARAEAAAQAAVRIGGWSLALAGIAYAALWAFAPLEIADLAGMAVVAGAMVVTVGYAVWAFAACRRADAATTDR